MNQINKIQVRNKFIPQDMLDNAVMFYFETETPKEGYEIQRRERYSQEKESGNVGEEKVNYVLEWLDSPFVKIESLSRDYSGKPCIILSNPDYKNIKQEYDHIVVGKAGVFNIETKNYSGKITIDKYGNWKRQLDGTEVGTKNPIQQVRQHEKVLKSFLPGKIKIINILCIANDRAIIEGIENSPLPIVKSDLLADYIERYQPQGNLLSDNEISECVKKIYNYMVKSGDK